jgi:hypothetical protein
MEYYYNAICLNGHSISDTLRNLSDIDKHCTKCGKAVISRCPSCNAPIRGDKHRDFVIANRKISIPSYCHECGEPYPWTKSAIEAVSLVLEEEKEFVIDAERAGLIEVLPDLMDETPKTNLAILRFQKVMSNCEEFAKQALMQFAVEFGCALAKQKLGIN